MIDIKQDALRTFKQYTLALALDFIQQGPDRIGINQNLRRDFAELFEDI